MPLFSQESLEKLRDRIDLVEVIASFVDLKKQGKSYKGRCPFHEEKTPSFMIQTGQRHYHCFGCGAHGDAIAFLMEKQSYSFAEAVEVLASQFHVTLEKVDSKEDQNLTGLKQALEEYALFTHQLLLYAPIGREALNYLYQRGFTLSMISKFQVGYAPKEIRSFQRYSKISNDLLQKSGLLKGRDSFFQDRILCPIQNPLGQIIGFSARKYLDQALGGKYINSPETPIFHKSKVFFGLNFCRKRIIEEKKVYIVEGHLDAMALIEEGLNLVLAPLGTAFTKEHVASLEKLGIEKVYLLFDSDSAGIKASIKAGNLIQHKGIAVSIVTLPKNEDPFSYVQMHGIHALCDLIEKEIDYLKFLVEYTSKLFDVSSPSGKNKLLETLSVQIKKWEYPVMVHESLKKLASLTQVPSDLLSIPKVKPTLSATKNITQSIEMDLFSVIFSSKKKQKKYLQLIKKYLTKEHFTESLNQKLFEILTSKDTETNFVDLLIAINDQSLFDLFDAISQKKIDSRKETSFFIQTLQKLLDRKWLQEREKVKVLIHDGSLSQEKVSQLAKKFDDLTKKRCVITPSDLF